MFQNEYEKDIKKYADAAEEYRPKKIKCLLVAESPPPKGYFYFPEPSIDHLFRSVMGVLFPKDYGRLKKPQLLRKFQDEGFFLIDVWRRQKELMQPEEKKQDKDGLFSRIELLKPTHVVLIGNTAWVQREALKRQIKVDRIKIINDDLIPLPIYHKKEFEQKLGDILKKYGLLPQK